MNNCIHKKIFCFCNSLRISPIPAPSKQLITSYNLANNWTRHLFDPISSFKLFEISNPNEHRRDAISWADQRRRTFAPVSTTVNRRRQPVNMALDKIHCTSGVVVREIEANAVLLLPSAACGVCSVVISWLKKFSGSPFARMTKLYGFFPVSLHRSSSFSSSSQRVSTASHFLVCTRATRHKFRYPRRQNTRWTLSCFFAYAENK